MLLALLFRLTMYRLWRQIQFTTRGLLEYPWTRVTMLSTESIRKDIIGFGECLKKIPRFSLRVFLLQKLFANPINLYHTSPDSIVGFGFRAKQTLFRPGKCMMEPVMGNPWGIRANTLLARRIQDTMVRWLKPSPAGRTTCHATKIRIHERTNTLLTRRIQDAPEYRYRIAAPQLVPVRKVVKYVPTHFRSETLYKVLPPRWSLSNKNPWANKYIIGSENPGCVTVGSRHEASSGSVQSCRI